MKDKIKSLIKECYFEILDETSNIKMEEGLKDSMKGIAAAGLLALSPMTSNASVYTIKSGDNLTKIAHNYDVNVNDLIKINKIENPNKLFVGQKINIPNSKISSDDRPSNSIKISDDFINYIKKVENSVKMGWKNGRWYPHKSPEGGSKTIAYGHKLKSGETFNGGLSEKEATDLLYRDINDAKLKIVEDLKIMSKNPNNGFKIVPLTQEKLEMFLDFVFNIGSLRSFPKFTSAVMRDDWDTVKKEYKRTYKDENGIRRELSGRNKEFYNRFLKGK